MLISIEERETASNRPSAVVSIENRTGGVRDTKKKKENCAKTGSCGKP